MGHGSATRVARDALVGPFVLECWGDFLLRDALGRIVTPRSRKARALLAYLSSRVDTPVARDRLAFLLWSDRGEVQARASLRQCLHSLHAFSHSTPPLISATRESLTMSRAALVGDTPHDIALLPDAVQHGEDELFRDLHDISEGFDTWLAAERARRRSQLIVTGIAAIEAHLARGQITEARELGDALAAIDPLDETVARAAMRADAQAADMGAIERRFASLQKSLAAELGISPAQETLSLHEQLMTQGYERPHESDQPQQGIAAPSQPATFASSLRPWRNRKIGVVAILAVILIGGLEKWRQERAGLAVATVAIMAQPGAARPEQSAALANALMMDLSRFASANPQLLAIVTPSAGATGGAASDFRVEVNTDIDKGRQRLALGLTGGEASQMLWSATFGASPDGNEADLRQQAAVKLAAVLICAMDARRSAGGAISTETLKLYLGVCDRMQGEPDQTVIAQLEQVTRNAPGFAQGWADLALAEANLGDNGDRPDARALADRARHHLVRARQLDPRLGQIYLAEALLANGASAFAKRLELLDKGIAIDPDYPALHAERALALMRVGRMRDAVASAQTAVEFDPLSPWVRNSLISALAYAGNMARARASLVEIQRLWPDAGSTNEVLYRFNLRYGDPDLALRLLDEAKVDIGSALEEASQRAFLLARKEPTPAHVDAALSAAGDKSPQPFLIQAFGHFGRIDQAYAYLDAQQNVATLSPGTEILFRTHMAEFRRDPRFIGLAAKLGLVGYWKSSGKWPDFCEDPGLRYDCRREAARY